MVVTRWIVLLILGLGALGCATNPSTGRNQLILFSDEEVSAMGEEAKPQLIKEFGGEVPSAELRRYVDNVGRSLAAHTEPVYKNIRWEFIVVNSDVVNAFALPGGKVFISRGLLALFENEAQVAGVLGHEIGHVTAKHIDERLSRTALAQVGLSVIDASAESELINLGAGLLTQGALLKFSRDQESEADEQGLKYMTATAYDPEGMLEVMRVLKNASKGNEQWEILATHPLPDTRIERITKLLETEYKFARNNPKYGKYPDRFRAGAVPYLKATRSEPAGPSWCALCGVHRPAPQPPGEFRLASEPDDHPPGAAAGLEPIGALR